MPFDRDAYKKAKRGRTPQERSKIYYVEKNKNLSKNKNNDEYDDFEYDEDEEYDDCEYDDCEYDEDEEYDDCEYDEDEEYDTDDKYEYEECNFRDKYPLKYRCKDGHLVRSKEEREIDNILFDKDITHAYEMRYLDINGQEHYPDFYIPKFKLYIEYFGMNDKEYLKKVKNKIKIYSKDKYNNFEYLNQEHDKYMRDYIEKIIEKYERIKKTK